MKTKFPEKIRHPADVFDMIVGTSTGGLIAFGLLGGKMKANGKPGRMSLEEIKEFYRRQEVLIQLR